MKLSGQRISFGLGVSWLLTSSVLACRLWPEGPPIKATSPSGDHSITVYWAPQPKDWLKRGPAKYLVRLSGESATWRSKWVESWASAAVVSDSGGVATTTNAAVQFFGPDGSLGPEVWIPKLLTQEERKQHVAQSSHSTDCGVSLSLRYFAEINRREVLVLRLSWGKRIVLNPDSGRQRRIGEKDHARLDEIESRFAVGVLRAAASDVDAVVDENAELILAAANLAAHYGLSKAVPYLRKLEAVEILRRTIQRVHSRGLTTEFYMFRAFVQTCLRRLGETKFDSPAIHFYRGLNPPGTPFDDILHGTPRPDAWIQIHEGMSEAEVLGRLGRPARVIWGRTWEYEVTNFGDPHLFRHQLQTTTYFM
ncbi:MAG: hypothetical protein AAF517_08340 [Planctomycetota bacterium]